VENVLDVMTIRNSSSAAAAASLAAAAASAAAAAAEAFETDVPMKVIADSA